jgi:putative hydrolase of the HAD superfamily
MRQNVIERLSAIRAIFFDIGRTLRVTRHSAGHDPNMIRELMKLLGESIPVESFIKKIEQREKNYRNWGKHNYIELNEEELLTRFIFPDHPQELIRANAITLNQLWRDSEPMYILPDMADTMHFLANRGYKLGIISNTSSSVDAHWMLKRQGLTEYFSTVMLSAVYGKRKPHPSIFLEAARQAGVHPQECAYIGDSPTRDLIGSRQSGFACSILINTEGYNLKEYDQVDFIPEKREELALEPDFHIGRLSDLLDIFTGLKNVGTPKSSMQEIFLYDSALSTMWGIDQKLPFEETFLAANRIGITRFELNHKVTKKVFDQFDSNRHYISTVHDPCGAEVTFDEQKQQDLLISSLDEEKRKIGVEIVCHSIDLARQLGARSVVIHPGSIQCDRSLENQLRELLKQGKKDTKEYEQVKTKLVSHRASLVGAHLEQVIKSLVEIAAYNSSCKGVALALENRYRYYDLPLPDELEQMLAVMGSNAFGFQYDLGHATVLDALDLVPHLDWLERFGTRIVGTHLHDVKGLMDHLAPGLGQVNYGKISPYLPENCIKTMEISPEASLDQIASGLEVLMTAGIIQKI